jgi:hypothetical protein
VSTPNRWATAGIDSLTGVDVSPFDPTIVYVWATTGKKAIAKGMSYFNPLGVNPGDVTAKPTGLVAPSQYREENVMVNEFEQNRKLRQDFPSQLRWRLKYQKES